jgi:alkyl hydroperoxide reductase subunit AhpC
MKAGNCFTQHYYIAILLLMLSFQINGQGYDIKLKINGLSDTAVILGHYLNKSMYPDDTIKLDNKGLGAFKGNKPLPEGMYLLYLPSSRYFEIIMGKDQEFSLAVDTADFLHTLTIKGSEENQIFVDFQKYMVSIKKQADSLTQKIKVEKDPEILEQISTKLKLINTDRIATIENISKEHSGLFVSDFLKATLDIVVPDPPRDNKGNITDSSWQYRYYRNHYFDNFNIADPRLLRTPLYEDKLMTYLTKVIPQIPDTISKEVDYFIEKSRADSGLFRFILITLFNYYGKSNIMGMDAVQVHIADKYYIHDSWWSDDKFIADLKDRIKKVKPLLIGEIAPDVELMLVPPEHFKNALTDTALKRFPHVGTKITLHQIKAKYLVLLFWEADCGHCKTAVPALHDIYEKSLKNLDVKVLAISTLFGEDGKIKWVDFINEHGLYGWLNTWNPYSYNFKVVYDIVSTPQIYILDENKKIIAKKISPEQVEEIITTINRK